MKTISLLRKSGLRVGGICCPEIREGKKRVGFRILDLATGEEGILAHIKQEMGPKVGKYRVNLPALENVGGKGLVRAMEKADVVVVDEIGPMEMCSGLFRNAVEKTFDSPKPLLAAVHKKTETGFIGEVKRREDVKLFEVSPSAFPNLPFILAKEIVDILNR